MQEEIRKGLSDGTYDQAYGQNNQKQDLLIT